MTPGTTLAAKLLAVASVPVALSGAAVLSPSHARATDPQRQVAAPRTITVFAFNVNPKADDLIPAPGTQPGVISEGDVSIVNDRLTSTHATEHGYPIIGYDSGTCTFTRVLAGGRATENCDVTAALPQGDLVGQGVVSSSKGVPRSATLAVTGGTGSFNGAHGVVDVTFGPRHDTYMLRLT